MPYQLSKTLQQDIDTLIGPASTHQSVSLKLP